MKKAKHCKYCGGLINEDRICTECGHKFFKIRIKKDKCITISLAISTLIMLFISLGLYNNNNIIHNNNEIYKQQIAEQNGKISDLNDEIVDLKHKIELKESAYLSLSETYHSYENDTRDELLEKYELEDTLNQYYVDFAYFAPRYGECYHKLDCYYLDNASEIYCDCIYDLENRGYRPCSECY